MNKPRYDINNENEYLQTFALIDFLSLCRYMTLDLKAQLYNMTHRICR